MNNFDHLYLDQYEKFGAFAFVSKAVSAKENQALESARNVGMPCADREIKMPSMACVHCDENSALLPSVIRGGHYLHNRHVCAVLGCEHAPYEEIKKLLANAEYCINPFPILVKGKWNEIEGILHTNPLTKNRVYKNLNVKISEIYNQSDQYLLYGKENGSGYPINKIVLAIAYLIAAQTNQLNGLRPKGSKDKIIREYLDKYPDGVVSILIPEIMTPLVVRMNTYAALVGPHNPNVNKKLIQQCPENEYKIKIREISEEDLNEKE